MAFLPSASVLPYAQASGLDDDEELLMLSESDGGNTAARPQIASESPGSYEGKAKASFGDYLKRLAGMQAQGADVLASMQRDAARADDGQNLINTGVSAAMTGVGNKDLAARYLAMSQGNQNQQNTANAGKSFADWLRARAGMEENAVSGQMRGMDLDRKAKDDALNLQQKQLEFEGQKLRQQAEMAQRDRLAAQEQEFKDRELEKRLQFEGRQSVADRALRRELAREQNVAIAERRDAERGAKREERRRKYFSGSDDWVLADGIDLTEPEIREARKSSATAAVLRESIPSLKAAALELGVSGKLSPEKQAAAVSAARQLQMLLKSPEQFNLGVLTGPDLDLLNEVVGGTPGDFNLKNLTEANIAALNETIKGAELRHSKRLESLGYQKAPPVIMVTPDGKEIPVLPSKVGAAKKRKLRIKEAVDGSAN